MIVLYLHLAEPTPNNQQGISFNSLKIIYCILPFCSIHILQGALYKVGLLSLV